MAITKLQSEALNLADDYTFTGGLSGHMYPAFEAYIGSSQTISENTYTVCQFNTENIDTDNCYDNSTNYRFTPNKAGKYYLYASIYLDTTNNNFVSGYIRFRKNGTELNQTRGALVPGSNGRGNEVSKTTSTIVTANGSTDYFDVQGYINANGATARFLTDYATYFGGYRIGS